MHEGCLLYMMNTCFLNKLVKKKMFPIFYQKKKKNSSCRLSSLRNVPTEDQDNETSVFDRAVFSLLQLDDLM